MSDIKFSCNHCQQNIRCEAGYAGLTIACPACHNQIVVPGTPAVVAHPAPAPAAPPPPAPALAIASGATVCPQCGVSVAPRAIKCIQCGTDLRTGQPAAAAAPGRPGAITRQPMALRKAAWYRSPLVWLGVFAALLAALYLMGRQVPGAMWAFLVLSALYSIGVGILVLIAAFKEGVGTGFMTLCIPFYALYFVYGKSENPTLKILVAFSILLNVATTALNVVPALPG